MAQPERPVEGASRASKEARPARVPIGTRNVLPARIIPGYQTRWVNDVGDRIARFRAAGYEPVESHEPIGDPDCGTATQVGSVVSKPVSPGIRGVLMKIKNEFYAEDQAAKQREIDEVEKTMQRSAETDGLTTQLPGQTQLTGIRITR